jgi:hypothetical protein
VPSKPFSTNYRIPTATGYVVINGEQIVKIVASRDSVFTLGEDSWKITFHLSDGSIYDLNPSGWTRNFVRDVFQGPDEE